MTDEIVGVILAAGTSSRLGQPKQLLDLHGRPLLEHTLGIVNATALDQVIVVLGGAAERIKAEVRFGRARPVMNPDYAQGQSTSLRAGLAAAIGNCPPLVVGAPQAALASDRLIGATTSEVAAIVFILGDQPLQRTTTIEALIAAYRRAGAAIVMPSYDGVRGNPVLFDKSLFPELAALTGDEGARSLLRAHAAQIMTVPVDGPAPADVDTWEDYQAILAMAGPTRGA